MVFKLSIAVYIFAALVLVNADSKRDRIYRTYACEGRTLTLSCGKDRIFIIKADYGRWNASVCPYYEDPDMDLNCHQPLALDNVINKCEKKSSCRFTADNDFFSNPCPGQIKYSEVMYTCISKWVMTGYAFLDKEDLEKLRQTMLPKNIAHGQH
ncbi:Calcium-independent receptor for alpha-latrotoxin [Carabus blaptoides fortunei]